MLIEDIMTREVVTLTPTDTVQMALRLAHGGHFRHLPVVGGRQLVGIVSDRDLRGAVPLGCYTTGSAGADVTVQEIMRREVVTCHPLDPVEDAARVMYEHKIGCLPVVAGEDLLGIVTEIDVLRSFVDLSGGLRTGSRLEIEAPNRPGVLADIGEITKQHDVNVASVFTTPAKRPGFTVLVVRIEALDVRGVVRNLKDHGYEVRWPNPLKGIVEHEL